MNQQLSCKWPTVLLAASCAVAAWACQEESSPQSETASRAATYHGEPSGPYGLSYEIIGEPVTGQPLEVRVAVVPPLPLSYVSVEVYAYDGLIVSPLSFSATAPSAGEPVERTLIVTPYMEGSLRLALLVSGDDLNGESQAGQITIPIDLGEPGPDPFVTDRLTTTPEGETIISLPAREN